MQRIYSDHANKAKQHQVNLQAKHEEKMAKVLAYLAKESAALSEAKADVASGDDAKSKYDQINAYEEI